MSELLAIFDLIPIGTDVWEGPSKGPEGRRAYGGQVMAQALAAAGRTVPDEHETRSLHAQFLRAGDAGAPVRYTVERVFDGRSSTARRVTCSQGDRTILTATATFAAWSEGPEHHPDAPVVAGPDEAVQFGPRYPAPAVPTEDLEIRYLDGKRPGDQMWFRTTATLPADPKLHVCVATFVMDLYIVDTILQMHGLAANDRKTQWASTDHAVWFQRPLRADQWVLIDLTSPSAAGGRGLVRGDIYTADGMLVGTLVQEGVARFRRE